MKKWMIVVCLFVLVHTAYGAAHQYEPNYNDRNRDQSYREEHSLGHKLLMYIPNRIFDLFDIVRARLRVGPGLAVGARVTTPVSAYVGSYAAIYAGLPGPRQEPSIPWPIGFESLSGVSVSVADAAIGGPVDPDYSPTEIGASLHLLLVGADLNADPVELVDFLAGFLFLDVRGDDL